MYVSLVKPQTILLTGIQDYHPQQYSGNPRFQDLQTNQLDDIIHFFHEVYMYIFIQYVCLYVNKYIYIYIHYVYIYARHIHKLV